MIGLRGQKSFFADHRRTTLDTKTHIPVKSKERPRVLLLGWVSIEPKQAYQLNSLTHLGYQVEVVTNDQLGRSSEVVAQLSGNLSIKVTGTQRVRKLFVIARVLLTGSKDDIALIPCASRMSAVIVILCRLRGLRTIVIEWGDISTINALPWLMRWNMRWSYVLASTVWFKEPYMEKLLDRFRAQDPFFLPNAIESLAGESRQTLRGRDLSFLWANRVIPNRYPLWLAEGLRSIGGSVKPAAVIMGLLPREQCDELSWKTQQRLLEFEDESLRILPYGEPKAIYARARFFVLAADHVFGNNALLESMAAGVVPIVSESPDVQRVVIDGFSGLIFPKSREGLEEALHRALALSPEAWEEMSVNAQATIRESFGVEQWRNAMGRLLKGGPSS